MEARKCDGSVRRYKTSVKHYLIGQRVQSDAGGCVHKLKSETFHWKTQEKSIRNLTVLVLCIFKREYFKSQQSLVLCLQIPNVIWREYISGSKNILRLSPTVSGQGWHIWCNVCCFVYQETIIRPNTLQKNKVMYWLSRTKLFAWHHKLLSTYQQFWPNGYGAKSLTDWELSHLIHWGLVTNYWVGEICHHCFRSYWLTSCTTIGFATTLCSCFCNGNPYNIYIETGLWGMFQYNI